MPGSRPFRALDYARFIIYTCYDEIFINQARAFPPVRKGALLLRVILCAMPYRKVTYSEQVFYILRYWIKDRVSRNRGSGCSVKPWAEAFYKGDAWQACRASFLASKGFLCERCSTPDDPVVAKIAHHKVYLNEMKIWKRFVKIATIGSITKNRRNGIHSTKTGTLFHADISPPIRRSGGAVGRPRQGE